MPKGTIQEFFPEKYQLKQYQLKQTNKVNKGDILEKLRDKEEEIKLLKSEISQLNHKK